jgi:hypothetical protein
MLEEDIVASLWINMYIVKWLMKQMWQYKITSSNNLDENNTTLCTTILRNTSWQNRCFAKTIKIQLVTFFTLRDNSYGCIRRLVVLYLWSVSYHSQLRRQTKWSRIPINCTAGLRQMDIL